MLQFQPLETKKKRRRVYFTGMYYEAGSNLDIFMFTRTACVSLEFTTYPESIPGRAPLNENLN